MLRFLYDTSMMALGMAFAFLGVTRFARRLTDRGVAITLAGGFAGVVGMAVVNACHLLDVASSAPYFAGVLILAVGLFAVAVLWFHHLASLPRDCVALLVLVAFVVSHVSCLVDMLPRAVAAVASMAYPLGSMAAFLLACKRESRGEAPVQPAQSGRPESERKAPDGYFRRMRSLALALIIAELVCGAFLRSRWAHGGVGYDPTLNTVFTYFVSAAIGVLLLVVVRRAKSTAEASLVIGGAGMAVFIFMTVAFSSSPVSLLAPVVTGLYSALLVYLMALIALWPSDGDTSSVTCAGVFTLLYGSVSGLTSTVIPLIFSFRGLMPDAHLTAIGMVAGLTISLGVCLVLFSMVVVHRGSYLEAIARAGLAENAETAEAEVPSHQAELSKPPVLDPSHERAMDALADTFGLTKRERETASLIARGYTAKRVADELFLTPGTVQGYSKSVYRKMGIHKKDELIEMVAQEKRNL
ncbi:MAG: helix-turn-helix transcriptional regulator [Eggerthellaceae bacterium]|nr:helix-turn-helix transcriptional regulator [Eggerthellaceae bacterium]